MSDIHYAYLQIVKRRLVTVKKFFVKGMAEDFSGKTRSMTLPYIRIRKTETGFSEFRKKATAVIRQGCSVLPNSLVIKNIFNIHTVTKKLHADIFDFVLSQNIDGKTS